MKTWTLLFFMILLSPCTHAASDWKTRVKRNLNEILSGSEPDSVELANREALNRLYLANKLYSELSKSLYQVSIVPAQGSSWLGEEAARIHVRIGYGCSKSLRRAIRVENEDLNLLLRSDASEWFRHLGHEDNKMAYFASGAESEFVISERDTSDFAGRAPLSKDGVQFTFNEGAFRQILQTGAENSDMTTLENIVKEARPVEEIVKELGDRLGCDHPERVLFVASDREPSALVVFLESWETASRIRMPLESLGYPIELRIEKPKE